MKNSTKKQSEASSSSQDCNCNNQREQQQLPLFPIFPIPGTPIPFPVGPWGGPPGPWVGPPGPWGGPPGPWVGPPGPWVGPPGPWVGPPGPWGGPPGPGPFHPQPPGLGQGGPREPDNYELAYYDETIDRPGPTQQSVPAYGHYPSYGPGQYGQGGVYPLSIPVPLGPSSMGTTPMHQQSVRVMINGGNAYPNATGTYQVKYEPNMTIFDTLANTGVIQLSPQGQILLVSGVVIGDNVNYVLRLNGRIVPATLLNYKVQPNDTLNIDLVYT